MVMSWENNLHGAFESRKATARSRQGGVSIIDDSGVIHNSNTLKLQGLFGARGAIKVRDI